MFRKIQITWLKNCRFLLLLLVTTAVLLTGINGYAAEQNSIKESSEYKALPQDCKRQDLKTQGIPVMFPPLNGIAFGLSAKKTLFKSDEFITFAVWVDNQTDKPYNFITCGTFDVNDIEVFDSYGHRLLSLNELRELEWKKQGIPFISGVCTRTFAIVVPPHTCEIPDTLPLRLTKQYPLPPGNYIISEKKGNIHKGTQGNEKVNTSAKQGLAITIE